MAALTPMEGGSGRRVPPPVAADGVAWGAGDRGQVVWV
jgi:hypothetical protein